MKTPNPHKWMRVNHSRRLTKENRFCFSQDPTTKILSAQLDKYQVGTVAGTEVPSPTGAAAQWRATFTNASPNVTIPQVCHANLIESGAWSIGLCSRSF